MARPSIVLMSAGGAGVLIALVLLWKSTVSGAPPVEPSPRPTNPTTEPAAATPATPPTRSGPAARAGRIGGTASAPSRSGTQGPAPSLTPAQAIEPSDDPSTNQDNLHFGATQLHAQTAAVEPLVRACVDKAVASGLSPSGKAFLTYIVAKQGDEYVIEDTSYDSEQTTLQNHELLECLHQTAKAMKFVGLPRRSKAIVVTRSVELENGAVRGYKHVTFSYLR